MTKTQDSQPPASDFVSTIVEEMRDSHQRVRTHLEKWFDWIGIDLQRPRIEFEFFHKRLYSVNEEGYVRPSVRIYFIAKLIQYINACTFEQVIRSTEFLRLASIGEFCITMMYLDNHVQDEKYRVREKDTIAYRENRDAYLALEDKLNSYIELHYNELDCKQLNWFAKRLMKYYRIGMDLDDHALTYENFVQDVGYSHLVGKDTIEFVHVEYFSNILKGYRKTKYGSFIQENFQQLYLMRTHLMNGVFFQVFTELLLTRYSKIDRRYDVLIEFARCYGMCQQLVNDTCDYIPVTREMTTVAKLAEDTFSDMRRRLVTLPIMSYLSNYPSGILVEQYATGLPWNLYDGKRQIMLLRELRVSRAIRHAKSIACVFAAHGESLGFDLNNPATESLQMMFSFARGNRFYKEYGLLDNEGSM